MPDCEREVLARGWCSTHYWRWYRHGDPGAAPRKRTFEEYLASSVEVADCWLWTRGIKSHGYGNAAFGGRFWNAHRLVWEQLVGPIPDGVQLDHLCRVRHCVNPDHLEPVTPATNSQRGSTARKRWCKRGHDLWDSHNLYITREGRRRCRACAAYHERNRRRRIKDSTRPCASATPGT